MQNGLRPTFLGSARSAAQMLTGTAQPAQISLQRVGRPARAPRVPVANAARLASHTAKLALSRLSLLAWAFGPRCLSPLVNPETAHRASRGDKMWPHLGVIKGLIKSVLLFKSIK